ncbi:MAG: PAS domain-containing protein [Spirochaetota bacterium]
MSDKNKKKYTYMYNKEQLRKDAEKYLKENEAPVKWTEDATIKEIIQELQVHQVELEIQNEELRNRQRQLEISRNQYSDLYENAPIVYLTLDINGYIHKSNIAGAKLFGLDSNINIKKPLAIFVASEYKPIMYKHLKDTIEKEEKQSCEIMIISNSGKKLYLQMESIASRESSDYDDKEKDNKKIRIRTAMIDITERKKAETARKEMEDRYKAVVEDQTELICRYKPDLTITFVNQAFCKYYNKSKEELIGNNLATQILDKYVPNEVRKKVTKKMSTLSINNPNIVIVHSVNFDKEVRLQKSNLRAIFNDEGEIIEYQSVDRDITEQKRAEEELRKFYRAVEYSPSIVVITNDKGII